MWVPPHIETRQYFGINSFALLGITISFFAENERIEMSLSKPIQGGIYQTLKDGIIKVVAVGRRHGKDCFAVKIGDQDSSMISVFTLSAWQHIFPDAELLRVFDEPSEYKGEGMFLGKARYLVFLRDGFIELEDWRPIEEVEACKKPLH